MGLETSLLERIAKGRSESRRDLDPDRVTESVLRHLERLFNARHGSVPARPDYGLPDTTSLTHTLAGAGEEFSRYIREAILAFEPRLQGATVAPDASADDPLRLCFRITAQLVCKGMKWKINFRTRLDHDGRFMVED